MSLRNISLSMNLGCKRLFFLLLLLILVIPHCSLLVARCLAKAPRLVLVGSTTILPLSEQLASQYRKGVGVDILVQGGGSSSGIKAVIGNIAQIAASSRELSEDELKFLEAVPIARDVLAIVVHPSNTIKDITLGQLKDVLSGKIKNWKQLGLNFDKPIQLVNDSSGAGTRAALEELVMGKSKKKEQIGTPITLRSVVVNSSAEMKANVANFKYAIGYLPFNYLDNTVKPLSINGIPPTYAAAYKGEYPLFRNLYYAIKKGASGLDLAYIYYVLSPEGQDVVIKEGFLPIKLITSVEELEKIRKVKKEE